jgi:hypothetical protein
LKIVTIDFLNKVKMKRLLILFFLLIQWAVQAQMVGTPIMPYVVPPDGIRAALSTNRTAYDNAASNTLVEITLAEYNNILATVSGASRRGYVGNMAGTMTSFGTTGGTNRSSPGTVDLLAANSYIAAASYRVYNTGVTGHIRVTAAASPTSPVTCLTEITTGVLWTANVTKYFAVKQPTTHSGSNTFVGHVNSSGTLNSCYPPGGAGCVWGSNTCGTASANSNSLIIGFQVIATTTKSW